MKKNVSKTGFRVILLALVSWACAASGATTYFTYTWKGGTSGEWADGANWESSSPDEYPYPPNGTSFASTVNFTNSAAVTSKSAVYFSELHIKAGCMVSVDTEGRMWAIANADNEMVFDVGENAELSVYGKTSTTVYSQSSSASFVKKGAGTMTMRCSIGATSYKFGKIDVREGTLDGADKSLRTVNGVDVYAGAVFLSSILRMDGGQVVNVREGGTAEIESFGVARFNGGGTLVYTPSGTFSVSNHLAGFSGNLLARGAAVIKASDPEFTSLSSIGLASGTTFNLATNATDQSWKDLPSLYGEGDVNFGYGPGSWTLGAMSLTGGTFTVSSSCAAPSLTIAGGMTTNLYLDIEKSDFRVNITGGDHHFRRPIHGFSNRKYVQTGGHVRGVITDSATAGYAGLGSNESYYFISGGQLTSQCTTETWSSDARVGYGCGVGIDASGDAQVTLRAVDSDSAHVLGNKKRTVLRVSENAVVDADILYMFSYWGGTSSTGTLDLAGGRFRVSKILGFKNDSSAMGKGSVGELLLRGGTLETGSGVAAVPNYAPSAPEEFKVYVGSAGGTIRVEKESCLGGIDFRPSTLVPYGSESDGGLVKRGVGYMVMTNSVNLLTGPLSVYGSRMKIAGVGGAPAWPGSVSVSDGEIEIASNDSSAATVASREGSVFTYANGSMLTIPSDVPGVTVGAASATAPSLVRSGRGTLVVNVGRDNGSLGTDAFLKVNGGMENDARTGLVDSPVFAATEDTTVGIYMSNRHWMRLSFLKYDDAKGLVAAEPVQGMPENPDGSTIVNVYSKEATLAKDAHVGALSLTHTASTESASYGPSLVIAEGCTLRVGNGAGTVAPVLLNSVCMANTASGATLSGGTVDFGEAEGVVMFNQSEYMDNGHLGSSWTTLSSTLAGSGGITFASFNSTWPSQYRRQLMLSGTNVYTGGTWIRNASVFVTNPSSLGSGAVSVEGCDSDGGQLVIDSSYAGGALANDLVLSGNGVHVRLSGSADGPDDRIGAVRAFASATLTGTVTLAGDTSVSSCGGEGCVLDFAGMVIGDAKFTVKGDGLSKTRLSGVNTYTGGTTVEEDAWLRVGNAAALGSGPVEVEEGGTLAFDDPASAECANEISGEDVFVDLAGRTVETGSFECRLPIINTVPSVKAKLRVTEGTGVYTGGDFGENIQLDVLPGATLDLGGGTVAVDYVRGAKRVVNGTLVVRVRDLGDFIGMTVIVR